MKTEFTTDYYKLFNIEPYSDIEQIKRAYRELSKKHHPDLGGNPEIMKRINEAYSVLSDDTLRNEYNKWHRQTYKKEITAHIFDANKQISVKKISIDKLHFDYKKYSDNDEIYIIVVWNGSTYINQVVTKSEWISVAYNKTTETQPTDIYCHILEIPRGTYNTCIDIDKLPKNYKDYLDEYNELYIFVRNSSYILMTYYEWNLKCNEFNKKKQRKTYILNLLTNPTVIVFIAFFFIVGGLIIGCMEDSNVLDTSYVKQSVPVNGNTLYSENDFAITAPLQISVGDSYYYLVKVVTKNNKTVQSVFIHPGETVEIPVPLGSYEIKYASGKVWYGFDKAFGPEGTYQKANETFDFYADDDGVNGYSLTLYAVCNGNMSSSNIGYNKF